MNLTDLLGNNDAAWMLADGRPCAAPSDKALDIRYHADEWFPTHASDQYAAQQCAGCDVAAQCLAYALTAKDEAGNPLNPEGIWGGTTQAGRKQLLNGTAA